VSREVDGGGGGGTGGGWGGGGVVGGGGHTRGHSSKGRAGAVSAPPGAGGRGMLSFDLDDEASGKRSDDEASGKRSGGRAETEVVTDERSESGAYEGDFEAEELEEGGDTVQKEGQEVSAGGGCKDGDGGVESEAGDAGGAAVAEEHKYEEEDKYEADFEDVEGGGGVG
jgi:hypothetical protein